MIVDPAMTDPAQANPILRVMLPASAPGEPVVGGELGAGSAPLALPSTQHGLSEGGQGLALALGPLAPPPKARALHRSGVSTQQ